MFLSCDTPICTTFIITTYTQVSCTRALLAKLLSRLFALLHFRPLQEARIHGNEKQLRLLNTMIEKMGRGLVDRTNNNERHKVHDKLDTYCLFYSFPLQSSLSLITAKGKNKKQANNRLKLCIARGIC